MTRSFYTRATIFFFLLSVAAIIGVSQEKKDKKDKAAEVTLTGEVTDIKCLLNGMASDMGDDHKSCAIDCIKGGLPVGIVDAKSKKLYVVMPAKGMKGANEDMVKYAGLKVNLTGSVVERDGAKYFFYTKVEGAK